MNLAQPDTGAAGNGDASNSIVEQVHHSAAALESGQTDALPFPGPYAYAVLPVVADQPGRADGAATHTTSAAAGGSSTATAPPSRADVPANSAMPEAPRSQPSGQASLPEGREADADGLPPLIRAVKLGDLEQLRMRLGLPGTDVNQVDAPSGATALLFAAAAGRRHDRIASSQGSGRQFQTSRDWDNSADVGVCGMQAGSGERLARAPRHSA
jgi:hypothetical protein